MTESTGAGSGARSAATRAAALGWGTRAEPVEAPSTGSGDGTPGSGGGTQGAGTGTPGSGTGPTRAGAAWRSLVGPGWGRAYALAGLLGLAGVAHLRNPAFFDGIVPESLPGSARTYTLASGVVELGLAGALAVPRTRRLGGGLAAAFFLAVFPANVKMTADTLARPTTSTGRKVTVLARLPLQVPLVTEAWKVVRPRR